MLNPSASAHAHAKSWNQVIAYKCADIDKNHQVKKKYTIQLGENELVLKVVCLSLLSSSFFSFTVFQRVCDFVLNLL